MQKQSSMRIAFPIASVWYGALVGPSMVSGMFCAIYFAPYGAWGLITPMISMALAAVIIATGVWGASKFKTYEYSTYGGNIYGRFSRYLMPILEIYLMLAMILSGAAVIDMSATFFCDLLGMPKLVGAILMAIINSLLVLWGDKLVRASSTVISVVLLGGFFLLVVFAVYMRQDQLASIFSHWTVPEGVTFASGIMPAINLGLSNAINAVTMCSVAQTIRGGGEGNRDSIWVGVFCFVLSSVNFIASTLMLLPYAPEALTQAVPNMYIIKSFLMEKAPWLPTLYNIVMLFALAGAPQVYTVTSRMLKLYPRKGLFEKELNCNIVSSIIYQTICILVSFLGLRTIISRGYTYLGYIGLWIVVVPVCVLMPIGFYRKAKTAKAAETAEQCDEPKG